MGSAGAVNSSQLYIIILSPSGVQGKALVGGQGVKPPEADDILKKNDDVFGAENLITSMYFRKLIFV
jgi:hypothetical protein